MKQTNKQKKDSRVYQQIVPSSISVLFVFFFFFFFKKVDRAPAYFVRSVAGAVAGVEIAAAAAG